MKFKILSRIIVLAASVITAPSAFASLIITSISGDTPHGYEQITPPGNTPLSNYNINGGTIHFQDGRGEALDPTNGASWWAFSADMPIFTTGLPSNSPRIEITFSNLNVYGFAFHIGANRNARAWFYADYLRPSNSSSRIGRSGIAVGPGNSPGFNIGNNGGQQCDRITKVVVDPAFVWGLGNMSIDTNGASCGIDVPAPGGLGLLVAALGFFALRRLTARVRQRGSLRQTAAV